MNEELWPLNYDFKAVEEINSLPRNVFELYSLALEDRPVLFRNVLKDLEIIKANKDKNCFLSYLSSHCIEKDLQIVKGGKSIGHDLSVLKSMRPNHKFHFWPFDKIKEALINEINNKKGATYYMQSTSVKEYFPSLFNKIKFKFIPKKASCFMWLGHGQLIRTHQDGQDNFAICVMGKKRFILFPKEQRSNLYLTPIDKNPAGNVPISTITTFEKNFKTYPRFKEALKHAQIAELSPGDALFLPSFWFHEVQSYGLNCLLNFWFYSNKSNLLKYNEAMGSFVHSFQVIKDLPYKERMQWKEWFDHYVFKLHGDPYGHIEQRYQGLYGKTNSYRKKKLRRKLNGILVKRLSKALVKKRKGN